MPRMSRKYCLSTSPSKMGFSQKSSCKSQGFLKRTSKQNKDKYIISPKSKSKSNKSKFNNSKSKNSKSKNSKSKNSKSNKSLFSNGINKPKIKSGYGTFKIAKQTLKNIKNHSKTYQKQIVNTMYNRAKYHKYQTDGMKDAMKIYKNWLNNN